MMRYPRYPPLVVNNVLWILVLAGTIYWEEHGGRPRPTVPGCGEPVSFHVVVSQDPGEIEYINGVEPSHELTIFSDYVQPRRWHVPVVKVTTDGTPPSLPPAPPPLWLSVRCEAAR